MFNHIPSSHYHYFSKEKKEKKKIIFLKSYKETTPILRGKTWEAS